MVTEAAKNREADMKKIIETLRNSSNKALAEMAAISYAKGFEAGMSAVATNSREAG